MFLLMGNTRKKVDQMDWNICLDYLFIIHQSNNWAITQIINHKSSRHTRHDGHISIECAREVNQDEYSKADLIRKYSLFQFNFLVDKRNGAQME